MDSVFTSKGYRYTAKKAVIIKNDVNGWSIH